jgi:hypothetical protein
MYKNKFTFSVFLAFMLSKANNVATKLDGELQDDFLKNILQPAQHFFQFFGLDKVKALSIFDLGYGFKGTEHTLNFLLTYTPIFFLILIFFNFNNLKKIFGFIKEKITIYKIKKSLNNNNKNFKSFFNFLKKYKKNKKEYKRDFVFNLYLKLTKQEQEFNNMQKFLDKETQQYLKNLYKQLHTF